MSFTHTKNAVLDGSKTVTRRKGWAFLKTGDHLAAVERSMGFKAGEKAPAPFATIQVRWVTREPLHRIFGNIEEVCAEGFPTLTPHEFVAYCGKLGMRPDDIITRIEFTLSEKR